MLVSNNVYSDDSNVVISCEMGWIRLGTIPGKVHYSNIHIASAIYGLIIWSTIQSCDVTISNSVYMWQCLLLMMCHWLG